MLLLLIPFICFLQFLAYKVLDGIGFQWGKPIVLVLLCAGHLLVFPGWYIERLDLPELMCGNPLLGIGLCFWVFGLGGALLVDWMDRQMGKWRLQEIAQLKEDHRYLYWREWSALENGLPLASARYRD